jgi:hypothetical protein
MWLKVTDRIDDHAKPHQITRMTTIPPNTGG